MVDVSVNSGITAQQGFALQRNMALFIILDNYDRKFNEAKYFLSLEHMEDILFCFLDDQEKVGLIETYQSKKKSGASWKINNELSEIIVKILKTGRSLISDDYPKSNSYKHNLYFSTNASIVLTNRKKELVDGVKKSFNYSETINEQNSIMKFADLNLCLRRAIIKKLEEDNSFCEEDLSNELDNLNFIYIDFAKISKEQVNQLRGKLEEVFPNKISDYKAALDSIFLIFERVSLTYNQKSIARISDKDKQISGDELSHALKVITTKSKAFDYWRSETRNIANKLKIKPYEKESFENAFTSAFDLFKSKEEAEYQKILTFVEDNFTRCLGYSEEEVVEELLQIFSESEVSNLMDIMLKSAMYAAYFQAMYKMES